MMLCMIVKDDEMELIARPIEPNKDFTCPDPEDFADKECIGNYIGDGFGSIWDRYCPKCGTQRQVVRPGKAQCPDCD